MLIKNRYVYCCLGSVYVYQGNQDRISKSLITNQAVWDVGGLPGLPGERERQGRLEPPPHLHPQPPPVKPEPGSDPGSLKTQV